VIFPLGNYIKEEVRGLARKFKLFVAEKKASQEICFLPDDDYRAFLKKRACKEIQPGLVVDSKGNIVGQHQGIAYYTIGQREGLGIARGYPVYITRIDPKTNKIYIGPKEEVYNSEFLAKDLSFADKSIKKKVALKVKIRYNHKEAGAELLPAGNKIKIVFKKPQFAITPGQSAVFYKENRVLGGAIIDKVIK
jgi:tRNA-specific 2-thiouridylase